MVEAELACKGYQKRPIPPSPTHANRETSAQYRIAAGEVQQKFRISLFTGAPNLLMQANQHPANQVQRCPATIHDPFLGGPETGSLSDPNRVPCESRYR